MHKIVNDPVHGFIQIKFERVQRCIDHPYFQRLRRISQLGLTHYVYPGAQHSRFHHAMGAMHLMELAIANLRIKGIKISDEEEEAACLAILLHDIGHGPFSHTLEGKLWRGVHHEDISFQLMSILHQEIGGLDLAMDMFLGNYDRPFFHQLISSQLDVDRMDYLKRDSFYTGVVEGNIGVDRILAMIDVRDGHIVVHEKGIMSIQNYLLSRNIMYWQVYLHKTVMSAENMLVKIFDRMIELNDKPGYFDLGNKRIQYFFSHSKVELSEYVQIDDSDIWQLLKELQFHTDYVLNILSRGILNRTLYKVSTSPWKDNNGLDFLESESDRLYFEFSEEETILAYSDLNPIIILDKKGDLLPYEEYIRKNNNVIIDNNSTQKKFYYRWKS